MKTRKFVLITCAVVALAGCANISKEDQGLVLGGLLGGVAGSTIGGGSGRTAAIIAGTLIGGYIGREVGGQMDREDQARHERAVANTIVSGGSNVWRNPQTAHEGGAVGGQYYQTPSGYCREYQEYVTINGRSVSAYGTACQQPDGSWRIMN